MKELYWSKNVCLEHFILTHHSVHDESCNGNHDNYKSHFFQAPGDDWTKAKGEKVSGKESECWKGALSWAPGRQRRGPVSGCGSRRSSRPSLAPSASTQLGSTPHLNPAQLQLQLQPTTTGKTNQSPVLQSQPRVKNKYTAYFITKLIYFTLKYPKRKLFSDTSLHVSCN